MNKDQKALLSDLIVLANADDIVTSAEYDFIHRIGNRMNISFDEVEELLKNPMDSKVISSEVERITHFHKLVMVMNVDQETHEKEIVVLRNFGLKMGIRPGAIDQILTKMNQYENKVIPAQELIQIFQAYYN